MRTDGQRSKQPLVCKRIPIELARTDDVFTIPNSVPQKEKEEVNRGNRFSTNHPLHMPPQRRTTIENKMSGTRTGQHSRKIRETRNTTHNRPPPPLPHRHVVPEENHAFLISTKLPFYDHRGRAAFSPQHKQDTTTTQPAWEDDPTQHLHLVSREGGLGG